MSMIFLVFCEFSICLHAFTCVCTILMSYSRFYGILNMLFCHWGGPHFQTPPISRHLAGWTDGRMVGRSDGRTVGRTDGRTDCQTVWPSDRRSVGRSGGQSDRRTDGQAVGRTDRQAVGQTDRWLDGQTVGWADGPYFRKIIIQHFC
jgi:hypothetical protein